MTDANFPAFPTGNDLYGGLTKREYFAGQAMAALLPNGSYAPDVLARTAYKCADAMCGNEPADVALRRIMAGVQTRLDVIQPTIVMGDEDSINLTPHQQGMQYAFGEVIKMIAGVLSGVPQ